MDFSNHTYFVPVSVRSPSERNARCSVFRTVFTASPGCRATWKRSKHTDAFGSHFAASMDGRHMSIVTTFTADRDASGTPAK